ncbi:Serine carboxypeptidase-like 51 [Linum perenne]
MEKITLLLLLPLLLLQWGSLVSAGSTSGGTDDGSEQWGYVEVRPKAHLFWWHYKSPYRVEDPSSPWPTILWLQGGPGGSGVGFGNFLELGPLDGDLQPRNFTWLLKADLLFVDSPVATGFSYVEDDSLVVKTDYESATDLTTLLKALYNDNNALQNSPLYIFAESYGGKFAVTLGVTAVKAIEAGELKLRLGGVALGDSWISPEHFTSSWGPLLKQVSRISDNGLTKSNSYALKIKKQLAEGQYENATDSWGELERVILDHSNHVDFYNFLYDAGDSPVVLTNKAESRRDINAAEKYTSRLISAAKSSTSLSDLMNGAIRRKLKIIPPNITWGGQGDLVFSAMEGDFMRPRIHEVDELLAKNISVTIYNGQVDVICSTPGVEAWLSELKWDGLQEFLSKERTPLYCNGENSTTKAFTSSHRNLGFYWILLSGHFVPVEQPCISLQMVGTITQSPSKA